MLPCNILRRSCSGEESTSSIWSAFATIQSGTRSRTCASVMRSTASAMLSRCWTLRVVMTSIPASSSSSTSSQRFSCLPDPRHVGMGELVDEHDLRMPTEHGVEVHLLEHRATMLDHPTRDDLEICQARPSHRSTVAFHDADHDRSEEH